MDDIFDRLKAALAGRYGIEHELGRGGMATVYLAEDLKHRRRVAVKVMLPELAAVIGADRFLREIEIAAGLSHPHILPLHDSGEADGFLYYVMPYVEGESLRDRLNREGQLAVEEVLRITKEVADGLNYAHERGVIHRDIKPENILLSGQHALISDFGIAKATSTAEEKLTATGLSLGTPEFMSPEQATGAEEVDGRSDLYSLACVVYQMLAGEPPHTGPNAQAVLAKVMTDPVRSVRLTRDLVPPVVDTTLVKALAKMPVDRFATVNEFAEALEEGVDLHSGVTAVSPTVQSKGPLPWKLVAVVAAVVAVAAVGFMFVTGDAPSVPQQPTARFPVAVPAEQQLEAVLPEGYTMQMAGLFGSAVAISRDGLHVVYVARHEGATQLFLRHIDELDAHPIEGTEGARAPFFSADGEWVGYFAGMELRKVPIVGRTPITVAGIDIAMFGASWSTSDEILIGHCTNGLERVAAAGGVREAITRVDPTEPVTVGRQHQFPQELPGGEWILFTVFNGADDIRIDVVSQVTGERRTVVDRGSHAKYLPSGHIVFALEADLFAAPFDVSRLRVTAEPVPVLEGVLMEADRGAAHYDVSENGTLVYVPGDLVRLTNTSLVWVDRNGAEAPLDLPTAQSSPRLSPDGKRILLSRPLTVGSVPDIWVYDLEGGTQMRMTDEFAEEYWAIWSHDGERIIFSSTMEGGKWNLFSMPRDGSEPPERITQSENVQFPYSVTTDGKTLAYIEAVDVNAPYDIWTVDLVGDRTPRPFVQTEAFETNPAFSPDGNWMAYTSNESGRFEVYVRPYPGPGGSRQISSNGGHQPLWSQEGDALYYRWGGQVMMVPVQAGPDLAVGEAQAVVEGNYTNTRGQWGAMYQVAPEGGRFLMVKIGDPPPAPTQYNVVLNWFAELERLVPEGGG